MLELKLELMLEL
ncbi:hypothetical protein CDAR_392851, partial [Caerostris darwini]